MAPKKKTKAPITKVRIKIKYPVKKKETPLPKKPVPLTAREKKIKSSEATIKRLKKEYGIKPKPKPKPKKKSLLSRAVTIHKKVKREIKRAILPKKPKKQKKTTWPSGITSQKAFEELMQIKKKRRKK